MANPTTYFGWVMPNSADLVTDLPADFNVFGQGVDTSMQDLLGGTTGQILSKTSATNMDFTWINNDTGDITGVTAGTGITGGGTSGTVTVTNEMATAITTSGDLVQGTGSGTFARLGTGTSGQYLTTNGTTNSWATPASGGMTLISTTTLTGASITLSSIPATYKNLYIVIRNAKAVNNGVPINMRFNADATANRHAYSDSWVSVRTFNQTSSWMTQGNDGNVTSTGLLTATIFDYTNTATWKYGLTFGIATDSTSGVDPRFFQNTMAYNQIGAISSLQFLPNSGNWTSGTVLLYGVS